MSGGPDWSADRCGQEEALSEVRKQDVKDWAVKESSRPYGAELQVSEALFAL